MADQKIVFVGTIASSASMKELNVYNGFLCVEHGKITKKGTMKEFEKLQSSEELADFTIHQLGSNQFVMPGLVDCHTHASQFPNIGLGLDKPLLEWLPKYTYPLEMKYSDVGFAARVYDKVVRRLLNSGTTTVCYFASMHLDGTLELVSSAIRHGQRALVGKVSMNVKNNAGYYNETQAELAETELFVQKVLAMENELVKPCVTPRGGVSCNQELITGLAKIANKYKCFVQSHISENLQEIEHVLANNPNCNSFAEVYEKCNLLHEQCVLAHAVHLTDEEIFLLAKRDVAISHCPAANTRLNSGLCPLLKLIRNNITVGLGTDVSAGDSASILDAMRRAMDVSMYADKSGAGGNISWSEAFYLGTLGGAKALKLEDRIGSLEVGKEFDALVVDAYAADGPVPQFEGFPACPPAGREHADTLLQRFIYMGDDRNILQVYVKGHNVKDITAKRH